MLKSLLQTIYGRHNKMVKSYELTISQLVMDSFAYTQLFFPLSLTGILPELHVRNKVCVLQAAWTAYSPWPLHTRFLVLLIIFSILCGLFYFIFFVICFVPNFFCVSGLFILSLPNRFSLTFSSYLNTTVAFWSKKSFAFCCNIRPLPLEQMDNSVSARSTCRITPSSSQH